jgi:hypothetical protein
MATWNLSQIRQKVRQVTGRLSPSELTNSQVDNYINQYYQFTFPAEVKLERQHTYYEFLTSANQSIYTFDGTNYTNVEPPATLDNLSLNYYQDPARFEAENPYQFSRLTPWTGDGVTVAFNTTVTGFPILPDSVIITDNIETFEDTNINWTTSNVVVTGDLGGTATINYSTGVINVSFNTAPPDGQLIYLSYIVFAAGRPTAVLFYNNQFKFFTPPDTVYRFKMKAYLVVSPLVNATDMPVLPQWGPAIAYGASRDIHSDFGEMQQYQEVTQLYNEQIDYVMTRTDQNLLNTRAAPFF